MKLDITPFQNALARLDDALAYCDSAEAKGDASLFQVLQGGAIQAFEYNYELSIKMLKRYLQEQEASAGSVDAMSFSDLIRRGYEAGLLQGELSVWKQFRHCRNISSHAYDEAKAAEVYSGIPAFRAEARFLLGELQRRRDD